AALPSTRRAERALAELDPHLLALVAAADVERDGVARRVVEQDLGEVALGADRLAVDRGDDVAPGTVALILEALVAAAGLQLRVVGRAAVADSLDPRARVDRQTEVPGELRIEGDALDAEVGVARAPVAAQLVQRAADGVDGHREPDARAVARLGL